MTDTIATDDHYRVVDDRDTLDLDVVHRALSEDSYWARGRPRAITEAAFAASRVVVALDQDGCTVGFARAVTDGCTFGWLADVWIEADHRGHGLGVRLVRALVEAPDLASVTRWMLATDDAHALYERFGFVPAEGDKVMQRMLDSFAGTEEGTSE